MFRNTRFQMTAFLAVGALLGYLAASGKLNPFQRADAAPLTAMLVSWGKSRAAVIPAPGMMVPSGSGLGSP